MPYDPNDPYARAQQQSYSQAQDWAGVAQQASTGMASAPTNNYSAGMGANIVQPQTPNYAGTSVRQPESGLGTAIGNDNFTQFKDQWWGDISQDSFGNMMNDPDKFRRMWAAHYGIGEGTQQSIQEFAPRPDNYLYGLGLDNQMSIGGSDHPQQARAELTSKFFDRILRSGRSGVGAEYLSPKKLMQTALDAVITKSPDGSINGYQSPLALQFADPAQTPEAQVLNFTNYVKSTVANLLPQESARAYVGILAREGDLFSDYITKNPTVNITFNKWIKDRLGPTGGI